MKRIFPFVMAILCVFMLAACGKEADIGQSDIKQYYFTETDAEPLWAQGVQSDGQLFQGLNLDGIGNADDEAYVSIFEYGEYNEKITVLRIHLGTGETVANVFPVCGPYNFLTGKLFSKDKDAIVLEVPVSGSNYGAVNIFALDVFPVGTAPEPISVIRMDTTKGIVMNSGEAFPNEESIKDTTKIVDIEDSPLQGLEIHTYLNKEDSSDILYWAGDNWQADDGWKIR